MPTLKNPKHEAFAQGIFKGLSAYDAYEKAKYKPSRSGASRLLTNVNIVARIAELQGRAAKKVEVTVESLSVELEEARGIAIAEKQSSAAVSATMGKAKLFGLGTEHRKLTGTIQVVTISSQQMDGLTPDELATLEAAYPILEKLGIVGGAQSTEAETTN